LNFLSRSYHFLARRVRHRIFGRSYSRARLAQGANPLDDPARREVIELARGGGLGDVIMCTPVLREIKRRWPERRLRFYTRFEEVVRGLPYIDEVLHGESAPESALILAYEHRLPPRGHLIRVLGESVGIAVEDLRLDCVVDRALVARFRAAWRGLPRPHVLVNRRGAAWTTNRNWPDDRWSELIARLSRDATVIEIGLKEGGGRLAALRRRPRGGEREPPPRGNYLDLRGRTSLAELVAAIAAADMQVGPDSGPLHVAAATGVPSVAIHGGYCHPSNTAYEGNAALYTPVPCAPCWLREPCPYGKPCLAAITPEAVLAEVEKLWRRAATLEGGADPFLAG
jgi:ADP-heptose:LPS heptosyltransferase